MYVLIIEENQNKAYLKGQLYRMLFARKCIFYLYENSRLDIVYSGCNIVI